MNSQCGKFFLILLIVNLCEAESRVRFNTVVEDLEKRIPQKWNPHAKPLRGILKNGQQKGTVRRNSNSAFPPIQPQQPLRQQSRLNPPPPSPWIGRQPSSAAPGNHQFFPNGLNPHQPPQNPWLNHHQQIPRRNSPIFPPEIQQNEMQSIQFERILRNHSLNKTVYIPNDRPHPHSPFQFQQPPLRRKSTPIWLRNQRQWQQQQQQQWVNGPQPLHVLANNRQQVMMPGMFAGGPNQQHFPMQIPAQQMHRRISPFPPHQPVPIPMAGKKVTSIRAPSQNSPIFPNFIYSPMQRVITPIGRMPLFF